jgi:hypothetical protein
MEFKVCPGCGQNKALTEYSFRRKADGVRQPRCRACTREQMREHYRQHRPYYLRKILDRKRCLREAQRAFLRQHLAVHPCVDCGEDDPRCLDFDHVRGKKRSDVTKMVGQFGWEALHLEVAKCEVRCANCHRKRTAERRDRRLGESGRHRGQVG